MHDKVCQQAASTDMEKVPNVPWILSFLISNAPQESWEIQLKIYSLNRFFCFIHISGFENGIIYIFSHLFLYAISSF